MKTIILIITLAALAGIAISCQSSSSSPPATGQANDPVKRLTVTKAGSELWGDNCTRCHNVRPPDYYSDAQWETIVHHMRLRANLTGQEARAITEFLKSAN